jgi:hypothetical protein
MKATNLTEQMSTKDIQAVESALKSLRQKAPQLVTLTLQERGLLRPPTHERLALMSRTLDAAKEHAGLLPQQFDLDAFKEQVAAVQGLVVRSGSPFPAGIGGAQLPIRGKRGVHCARTQDRLRPHPQP